MALGHDLHTRSSTKEFRTRLLAAMWLVGLAIVLLLSRLYTLQVLRGEELDTKGRRNFVQQVQVPHDRGIIYDRHGRILVDNRPSIDLQVTPAFLGKKPQAAATLEHLATVLKMTEEELQRARDMVNSRRGLDRFRPLTIRRDLDPEQIEAIEGERSLFMLDGVDVAEGRRRTYPYGALAAHLMGYVNEIDGPALDAERARGNPEHYDLGDIIGREGIERTYEKELRGLDGIEKVVVDAKGRRQQAQYIDMLLGDRRRIEPTPGHNVFLTIDLDVQLKAEEVLAKYGRAGSIVAMDARSGAILAIVSLPAYDANLLSGNLTKEIQDRYNNDLLTPWVNRSISGQYAPGSTFKVVTALAALGQKVTSPTEHVSCPGYYKMGRHVWRCWRDAGHGQVDLHDALKKSCDTYFYTMGGRMGINPIAEMARILSFGSRTGIPLRGEQPGNVPDEAFHNRADARTGGYQKGMAINTSIGQGSLLVTPLQLATCYAAIANGKEVFTPQVIDRVETADLRVTRRFMPQAKFFNDNAIGPDGVPALLSRDPAAFRPPVQTEVRGDGPTNVTTFVPRATAELNVPPEGLAQVRAGLAAVAQEPGGTAYWRRSRKVTMAGKTGTAQVMRLGAKRGEIDDYFQRDHAWFASYAPADDQHEPEIVVVVLNEHGSHGASAAAPIATEVIDAYIDFRDQRAARAAALPASEVSP